MEEELNTYYSDLKSLTFEKLLKNYEVMENNTCLNYDDKIDQLVKEVL